MSLPRRGRCSGAWSVPSWCPKSPRHPQFDRTGVGVAALQESRVIRSRKGSLPRFVLRTYAYHEVKAFPIALPVERHVQGNDPNSRWRDAGRIPVFPARYPALSGKGERLQSALCLPRNQQPRVNWRQSMRQDALGKGLTPFPTQIIKGQP